MPADQIPNFIDQLEKEAKAFKTEALKMSWYMRGGVTYEDVMMMSAFEKEEIAKIIKDNIETTKKSGLPFY